MSHRDTEADLTAFIALADTLGYTVTVATAKSDPYPQFEKKAIESIMILGTRTVEGAKADSVRHVTDWANGMRG